MRPPFVLFLALILASPAAASSVVETKLAVVIDGNGTASATVTVTNHSDLPICFLPKERIVFLSDAAGHMLTPIVANIAHPWPDDMPVIWDHDTPRDFELPLDPAAADTDLIRRATRATYDFEAYDCASLFADRAHVRPRYKRKLTAKIAVAQ